VAALLRRCLAAYGGPTALQAASKVRQEGTVTSIRHPGEQARLVRTYDRVRGLRVQVGWRDRPESRLVVQGRGWRDGEEVQGPPLTAMLLQAARLDLPALLQASAATVLDRGTIRHEGRTLRALAVVLQPGVSVEADLDPGSGRILRSRGAAAGPPSVEFVTTYDDFRTVDGVLVPFREGNWANGAATGETVLRTVRFLYAAPEATFTP
jgi:hypothetical protein